MYVLLIKKLFWLTTLLFKNVTSFKATERSNFRICYFHVNVTFYHLEFVFSPCWISILYSFCTPRIQANTHFSASIFNLISLVLMIFYQGAFFFLHLHPSQPSSGGLFSPPSPSLKASPLAHPSPSLTMASGAGCVLLLGPDSFHLWLRSLFLQGMFQLPANPSSVPLCNLLQTHYQYILTLNDSFLKLKVLESRELS